MGVAGSTRAVVGERLKQEGWELEGSLGYTGRSWGQDNKAQPLLLPGSPSLGKQRTYLKKHIILNTFCFPSSQFPLIPEPFPSSVPSNLVTPTLTCLTSHQLITPGVLGCPLKSSIATVTWPLDKG